MNFDKYSTFPVKMDTRALGIEFKEEAQLVESAARRKEAEIQKLKSSERNNQIRTKIIQEYFLKMSNSKKIEFLVKLLNNVRTADSVMHIMLCMPIGYAKGYNYSAVDHTVDLVYEKVIIDHNRMLDESVLEQTIADDLEWYRNIPDSNQVLVFIDLLRRGGGYQRRAIVVPLLTAYFKRMKIRKRISEQTSIDLEGKKVKIKNSISEIADNTVVEDEDPFDPTHPSTIEVMKLTKKWNDIIAKYRKEVETGEKKLDSMAEDEKKGGAADKNGKKSKESKKPAKGKKVEEEIDRIQTIPVWIIKKIFGYLDQKTLKKMKVVNSYWAFIIQDLLGDMKMRKKLDKAVDKLKSQMDPTLVDQALAVAPVAEEKKTHKSKRVKNKNECGVIAKELIPPMYSYTAMEKSLIADIENEIYVEQECISMSNKPLLSFPRVDKDEKFHRQAPCILRDVNVVLGVHEGMERNISFLTYSLSSRESSSMEFDVAESDLADW